MNRRGIAADILSANIPHFFYTRRRLDSSPPVSIIVPFRDEPALLEKCLNSVLTRTTYGEYEIIGVNNQSASPITFELMEAYRANPRIRFVDYDDAFNFSAIVNRGANEARGDYLVLLNNDIEIITGNGSRNCCARAVNPGTGAVGGKLYYPDNTIQHAGIVIGIDGYAGHGHKHFECHAQGYGNRLQLVQNVSAVTGAFMMVSRALFESVGGFDAQVFPLPATTSISACA
ncbi:MAG: glycosyltransferase [Gammaproteobacteria bacterium]|nr:glycosyltransferase [Gammaproteobacteria bacterium]